MAITDKTLGEACLNPDGQTYDGRKVARWLFEAVTGKPMSEAEAEDLIAEAKARAHAKRLADAQAAVVARRA